MPNHVGTVYRGFFANASDILARYKAGSIVTESAFTSTDVTRAFEGNIFMTITSATGKDITQYSAYAATESEVLFNQGTKFFVDSAVRAGDNVVIALREVP